MTRRGFLGSLAAVMLAPPSSGRAAAVPPIEVRGLNHATLVVSDLARSLDFYQALFGMPVQARQGATPCLRVGTGPTFLALANAAPQMPPGLHHFALAVENFDAEQVVRDLAAHGVAPAEGEPGESLTGGPLHARVRLRGEAQGGAPGGTPEVYLGDPDGIIVQLQSASYCGGAGRLGDVCPSRPEPAPSPGALALRGINHFTVFSTDAARSLAFYQRVFGLKLRKTQGSLPLLDVSPSGDQIIAFVGGPGVKVPPMIHHVCVTIDDFQHERVLDVLAGQGVETVDDPMGRSIPPLRAYVTQRMPDRGGAAGGTPELYFTDPDGTLVQIQDTRYCGGAGYLGEVCAYL